MRATSTFKATGIFVFLGATLALSCGGDPVNETASGRGTTSTGGTAGGGSGGTVTGGASGASGAATGGASGTATGGSPTGGTAGGGTAGAGASGGSGGATGGTAGTGAGRAGGSGTGGSGKGGSGGGSGDWTCEDLGAEICFCRRGGDPLPGTECAGPSWTCCALSEMNCQCFSILSESDCTATIAADSRLTRTPSCPP